MSTGDGPPWIDERHMLHAGTLAGTLHGAGLKVLPICDANGVVTPILQIEKDDQVWLVMILPESSTNDGE